MQKLVIGMPDRKNFKGFTLIEILIVIVIITITVNFTILAFGDFGEKTKITYFAKNFVSLISLIKKEAILSDKNMAINIKKDNFTILKFNNNSWQTDKNTIYKKNTLPNGMFMFLINKNRKARNQIYISSDGVVTPFTLSFGKSLDKIIISIRCDKSGNIKLDEK